jgi:hypothetical protein
MTEEKCKECKHLMKYHDDHGCSVWSCINDRQYCDCETKNVGNVSTYDDEVLEDY